MINKLSYTGINNKVSFKNSLNDDNKNTAKSEKLKSDYKNLSKMGLLSALIGLGTLGAAKIAKKDTSKSLEFGICSYFVSYIVMALANGIKEVYDRNEPKS